MMVSGEKTPEYITCFVEDCGYTSVWDQFSKELKGLFGLPLPVTLYGQLDLPTPERMELSGGVCPLTSGSLYEAHALHPWRQR